MKKVKSIHEYKLKAGVKSSEFEKAIQTAKNRGLFNLPGLIEYKFLKCIRGTRKTDYSAIWIYKDKESWIKLWGRKDNPVKKEHYPEKWKIWEDEILVSYLSQDPDRINCASYDEL